MPRASFMVDPDLVPLLERYRAENMPNASLGDVCLELLRIALIKSPEEAVFEAARLRGERAGIDYVHAKFRSVIRDVLDESLKISAERAVASEA